MVPWPVMAELEQFITLISAARHAGLDTAVIGDVLAADQSRAARNLELDVVAVNEERPDQVDARLESYLAAAVGLASLDGGLHGLRGVGHGIAHGTVGIGAKDLFGTRKAARPDLGDPLQLGERIVCRNVAGAIDCKK